MYMFGTKGPGSEEPLMAINRMPFGLPLCRYKNYINLTCNIWMYIWMYIMEVYISMSSFLLYTNYNKVMN